MLSVKQDYLQKLSTTEPGMNIAEILRRLPANSYDKLIDPLRTIEKGMNAASRRMKEKLSVMSKIEAETKKLALANKFN